MTQEDMQQAALEKAQETAPELSLTVSCHRACDMALIVFTMDDISGKPILQKCFAVNPSLGDLRRQIRFQAHHAARALAYARATGMTREAGPDGIIRDVPLSATA